MIQLNLLPDVKREYIRAQKTRNKVITGSILLSLLTLGLLAVLAVYVFIGQNVHQRLLDSQIDTKAEELSKDTDLGRYLTIQNQLASLPKLHSEKGSHARLFDYLVQVNPAPPDNVRISKLTLDTTSKTLTIEGFADNYKALNVFEKTLQNAELVYKDGEQDVREKMFVATSMGQVGVGDQQTNGSTRKVASFTAVLTFADKAFSPDIKPSVQIPNVNITNSVQNAPGAPQLFQGQPEGN